MRPEHSSETRRHVSRRLAADRPIRLTTATSRPPEQPWSHRNPAADLIPITHLVVYALRMDIQPSSRLARPDAKFRLIAASFGSQLPGRNRCPSRSRSNPSARACSVPSGSVRDLRQFFSSSRQSARIQERLEWPAALDRRQTDNKRPFQHRLQFAADVSPSLCRRTTSPSDCARLEGQR